MRSTLRRLREQNGLKISQLAAMLNVSPRTVYYVEQGKRNPSLGLANKLEDIFGVPQRELLALDKEKGAENDKGSPSSTLAGTGR